MLNNKSKNISTTTAHNNKYKIPYSNIKKNQQQNYQQIITKNRQQQQKQLIQKCLTI